MQPNPIATYLGCVGIIIGGLGIGFNGLVKSEPASSEVITPAPTPVASEWPPKNGAVAFAEASLEVPILPVAAEQDTAQARYRQVLREPMGEPPKERRRKVRVVYLKPSDAREEARAAAPQRNTVECFGNRCRGREFEVERERPWREMETRESFSFFPFVGR